MEVAQLPQIETLQTGRLFKILRVIGEQGIQMPLHHSTGEAILIGQRGSAVLYMDGKEYEVARGSSIIIPSRMPHSLNIIQDFHALVIMDNNSIIEFEK